MYFYGASSKESDCAQVIFISPYKEVISLSYKLEFENTNKILEYEDLVLGLREAKDIKNEDLSIFGDPELIVHQVRNLYQAKHTILRTYRNEVWDRIDNFFLYFNISFVPREENAMDDSLVVFSSNFKIPLPPNSSMM
jgi:ribonuclease HI